MGNLGWPALLHWAVIRSFEEENRASAQASHTGEEWGRLRDICCAGQSAR